MDALDGLTFASPERLWLIVLLAPVYLFLFRRESFRRELANRFVSERMRGLSNGVRAVRPHLIAAGLLAGVLASAGPRYGIELREAPTVETSTIVVFDLSASMDVRDLGASRLEAGKALARRIIQSSVGRIGLIVYEGSAEVIAPLTDDQSAVVALLESMQTGELEEAGSDLSRAIEKALELASTGGTRSTVVVIISDGEHRGRDWNEQLSVARTRGMRISAIVLGTSDGGPVPDVGGGDLVDSEGARVISRASKEPLATITAECNGELWVNPFGEEPLRSLQRDVGEFTGSDRFDRIPRERYQWPLGASVLFFLTSMIANRGGE